MRLIRSRSVEAADVLPPATTGQMLFVMFGISMLVFLISLQRRVPTRPRVSQAVGKPEVGSRAQSFGLDQPFYVNISS
jgi:hypothetical protein